MVFFDKSETLQTCQQFQMIRLSNDTLSEYY